MAKVSAADRRAIESALLRVMPNPALESWRTVCEDNRDSAEDSRVWHYWQGQLVAVRSILELRGCPPAAQRGRDMPSVDAADSTCLRCSHYMAAQGTLCPDCAAKEELALDDGE